ncbi:MAG TPA: DUF58 domain-containing protein [Nitrolancea sp.]|nr:DUF58 domain-containing protein [Nitrolancea sp.]
MDQHRVRSYFFNSVWFYGSAILLLLGMALRQPALSILAFMTLLTAGSSKLWSRNSLKNVVYRRHLSNTRIFRGESIEMTAEIVNHKWLPLPWIEVEDQVSDRIRLRNQETLPSNRPGTTILRLTTSVRWFERVTWSFSLDCPHRGAFVIGPLSLRSGDLFGFFSEQQRFDQSDQILVYPRIIPLEDLGLPPRHPLGDSHARRQLIADPTRTIGVREYRPEDAFRFINWKATAKLQKTQVKVFEPTVSLQLGIFLNLDTFERPWEGIDYTRAESAITVAASLASHSVSERYLVGMYANGVLSGSDQSLRIRPGLGPDQLTSILEGLAKLTPLAATNFQRLLQDEARRFPWGSTIVIVTALMTEPLAQMIEELLNDRHQIILLCVGTIEVPSLPGLVVHMLPDDLIGRAFDERSRYVRMIDVRG